MNVPRPIVARRPLAQLILIGAIAAGASPCFAAQATAATFTPDLASLRHAPVPEWIRDAKFGIWSHWGPASVPGINNEYPKEMYRFGSVSYRWHVANFGHPSEVGYKDVIESWKAERFEPDQLMAKYRAAGAKFFVALATHHDNFDCFDSDNPWNSLRHGPRKDIVGLWREAALRAELRFGVSTHADDRGWNYYVASYGADPSGPKAGVPYDGQNPANVGLYNPPHTDPKQQPPAAWLDLWSVRHRQLVDRYQPDLLYFDGGIPFGSVGLELVAHYLNGNRAWNGGKLEAAVAVKSEDMLRDYERGTSPVLRDRPWLCDTSMGGWFFLNDQIADPHSRSKNATTIIHLLADIVSKNGNLLLNLPQRGDGSLYPECETVLDELAEWMTVNGEAIFGTRPWVVSGEGPSREPTPRYMNELTQPLTPEDFRFTTKGESLYAISLGVPQKLVRIAALGRFGPRIARVSLLGSNETLRWKQEWEGLAVEPPAAWPSRHAVTFVVTLAKP